MCIRDRNTASVEHSETRNWSRELQPLQEDDDDGSESEEEVETFDDKAVNGIKSGVNRLNLLGDSRPPCNKADDNKTENEVRMLTIVSGRVISIAHDRNMLEFN